MDLKTFDLPKQTGADIMFPTYRTIPALLEEAKLRKFYNGNTPYNKLFSDLFYSGGKVVFKKDVEEETLKTIWSYCRSFMGSWEPKHEEKEAICAMLMSEVLEPKLAD